MADDTSTGSNDCIVPNTPAEAAVELPLDEDAVAALIETGIDRDDWSSLSDACPECGATEFKHFTTTGGHYGLRNGTPIERTDYWDANQQLKTVCLGCGTTLYKHPAFSVFEALSIESE